MDKAPGFGRIVATDPALQFVSVISIFWIALAIFAWTSYTLGWVVPVHSFEEPPGFLKVAALALPGILLFGLPAIWWVFVTKRTFRHGESKFGTISRISPSRGGTAVEYKFFWQGTEQTARAFSSVTSRLRSLAVGDRISVIVDPRAPKRSFIRELYLEEPQRSE